MTEPAPSLWPKLLAELIGTFALVFAGCGSVVADVHFGAGLGTLGIALVFGFVVMVMIYAVGHVSGAHFNPAVTVAFASLGRFPKQQVLPYIAAQILGAVLAAALLRGLLAPEGAIGATVPRDGFALWQAAALEVVLTFFLMFVITSVATDARAVGHMAGWAIGATVALCAAIGGPMTGASMNPARSLGPALFDTGLDVIWIYLAAPVVGALLGAWAYHVIRCDAGGGEDAKGCC